MAGSGHPLGGLADIADGNGRFSLSHKGQGKHPSYIKTQYMPNLSQLGPWPLKGHHSMRALAVGRCEQLGWPSEVVVLGARGGQGPSGLPLGVQCPPLGGRQGDFTLAVRRRPPPPGPHTARKISHRTGAYQGQNCWEIDLCMPTEGPPLQTALNYETPAPVRPQKWPLWRSDRPPVTVCN